MNELSLAPAAVSSAVLIGAGGLSVTVETHFGRGLPGFTIVGLPDSACREVRDRVRAALLSSGLSWPLQQVTVTITPDRGRAGTAGLDLPIALTLLAAAGELPADRLRDIAAVGELGLDGSLRPVRGIVPLVNATAAATVVVPDYCRVDAELVPQRTIRSAPDLRSAVEALRGDAPWPTPPRPRGLAAAVAAPDLAHVRCGAEARRAVEVAAAGGHHLLLVGAPGSGAATLARCLVSLLPPLTADEAFETARIQSAAGHPIATTSLRQPPFRAPHPAASVRALAGGGGQALGPGELALAHNGVLLLEDVDAYDRAALDVVTHALDNGTVRVSRARAAVEFPTRFLAVATSPNCPCRAAPGSECRCTRQALHLHARRIRLPLYDRFPIRVSLSTAPPVDAINAEASAAVGARVIDARSAARRRGVRANAQLISQDDFALTAGAKRALDYQRRVGALSIRALDDACRVARTIADLRHTELVDDVDVLEALALRVLRSSP